MKRAKQLSIASMFLTTIFVGCTSTQSKVLSHYSNENPSPQFAHQPIEETQPASIEQVSFNQPIENATGNPIWHESLEEARRESTATGKPILTAFTGSDWCPPCIKLKKNVFETPEFTAWAAQNVVLLELDFPKTKPQPQSIRVQNQQLAKQFKIEGYPTVVFVSDSGKQLGRMGFAPNVDQWLAGAKTQLK